MPLIFRFTLLFFGTVLFADCFLLFGFGKVNFGTVVPFFIAIIFLFHALFWQRIQRILNANGFLKKIWTGLWGLFAVWLMSFIAFVYLLQKQIQKDVQVPAVRAVIILGAGVVGDKPSLTLANRLDSAAVIVRQQPNIIVVTSGGVGVGERFSEAYVMSAYLQNKYNISATRIKEEGKSTSTEENLLFSKTILLNHDIRLTEPIAIVTSDFHTIRAKAIATKLGYENTVTIASKTPWSTRFNDWFREYFAFVSGWLLGEY